MEAMTKSIETQYQSDDASVLRSLVSNFYFSRAPEEAAYPIIVFHMVTQTSDYVNTDVVNTFLVQFNIFAETIGEGITLISALDTAYQNKTLTLESGNFLVCRKAVVTGPVYNENIYQTTVDYVTMESRSL